MGHELRIKLHVEAQGTGPTVLLGHGFAGSARNFRPQARALRERYRVVLFDARGHARSTAPRESSAYRLQAFTGDLARILDDLGVEAAVVGGLSMGAAVALHFALGHPDRVRGLLLAAPPAGGGKVAGASSGALRFAAAIERDGVEAAGEEFVWGPRSGLDVSAARWVKQGFLEHPAHGLAHILRELLATLPELTSLAPQLSQLRVPTLIVTGTEDPISEESSTALDKLLPDARLVWIEAAGHVVNLAQPAPFNRALETFLDSLPEGVPKAGAPRAAERREPQ